MPAHMAVTQTLYYRCDPLHHHLHSVHLAVYETLTKAVLQQHLIILLPSTAVPCALKGMPHSPWHAWAASAAPVAPQAAVSRACLPHLPHVMCSSRMPDRISEKPSFGDIVPHEPRSVPSGVPGIVYLPLTLTVTITVPCSFTPGAVPLCLPTAMPSVREAATARGSTSWPLLLTRSSCPPLACCHCWALLQAR